MAKSKIFNKKILLCFFLSFLLSCQTVTISPLGKKTKYSGYVSYEKSQKFFFWGLVGERFINVKRICGNRVVKQMQTQQTFLDGFLAIITLGIYSPRTAKVWCGRERA